jgi:hypothetical protein
MTINELIIEKQDEIIKHMGAPYYIGWHKELKRLKSELASLREKNEKGADIRVKKIPTGFIVEKSIDGEHFVPVAKMKEGETSIRLDVNWNVINDKNK